MNQNSQHEINIEFNSSRTCAWGTYKPDPIVEDKPEGENPETENPEAAELAKPKDEEEYEFIVSGALGQGNDNPEVKVWKVVNEKVKNIHTLTGHSLGIVSVDISPNGKCEWNFAVNQLI